jgi:hypothetical protein
MKYLIFLISLISNYYGSQNIQQIKLDDNTDFSKLSFDEIITIIEDNNQKKSYKSHEQNNLINQLKTHKEYTSLNKEKIIRILNAIKDFTDPIELIKFLTPQQVHQVLEDIQTLRNINTNPDLFLFCHFDILTPTEIQKFLPEELEMFIIVEENIRNGFYTDSVLKKYNKSLTENEIKNQCDLIFKEQISYLTDEQIKGMNWFRYKTEILINQFTPQQMKKINLSKVRNSVLTQITDEQIEHLDDDQYKNLKIQELNAIIRNQEKANKLYKQGIIQLNNKTIPLIKNVYIANLLRNPEEYKLLNNNNPGDPLASFKNEKFLPIHLNQQKSNTYKSNNDYNLLDYRISLFIIMFLTLGFIYIIYINNQNQKKSVGDA